MWEYQVRWECKTCGYRTLFYFKQENLERQMLQHLARNECKKLRQRKLHLDSNHPPVVKSRRR